MRKKRELEIAGYIDTLPLEYRGREPVCPSLCVGQPDYCGTSMIDEPGADRLI